MMISTYLETRKLEEKWHQMKKCVLLFFFVHIGVVMLAQNADSTKKLLSGAVSVTNNGISLVPAFSLEKPAAIFDLAVRKNKFSFEPQLAFGFEEAKPWYFVFWFWYKLLETSKFDLGAGFHPGFLFSTTNVEINGLMQENFTASRFFVGALTPGYSISKDFRIGLYLQQARGYNSDLKNSSFLGLNCSLSNLNLGNKFNLKVLPQIYYLKNDNLDGSYLSSTFTLSKKNFPLTLSSLLNKKIKSNIPSRDFIWNLTLTFSY